MWERELRALVSAKPQASFAFLLVHINVSLNKATCGQFSFHSFPYKQCTVGAVSFRLEYSICSLTSLRSATTVDRFILEALFSKFGPAVWWRRRWGKYRRNPTQTVRFDSLSCSSQTKGFMCLPHLFVYHFQLFTPGRFEVQIESLAEMHERCADLLTYSLSFVLNLFGISYIYTVAT